MQGKFEGNGIADQCGMARRDVEEHFRAGGTRAFTLVFWNLNDVVSNGLVKGGRNPQEMATLTERVRLRAREIAS
eukprot:5552135-Prorocentrum_lima.AAC.1